MIKVLDKGFVEFVDSMGNDLTIVNSARISFGKRKDKLDDKDIKLIKYLVKEKHFSPLRHCYLQFHIKAPEFVMRQAYKHIIGIEWTSGGEKYNDTAFNEKSGRFVEYEPEFYVPIEFRAQSANSKQASTDGDIGSKLTGIPVGEYENPQCTVKRLYEESVGESYENYKSLLKAGLSREQARCVLPFCLYTEVYWSASLQAVAHFVKLRNHKDAQYEIREYAKAVEQIATEKFPIGFKALIEQEV